MVAPNYSLVCWGGRTGRTVSISASTDQVTFTNHGVRNGLKLWPSGTLPAELSAATPVYSRYVNSTTFTLHTSAAGAIAGTGQILFAGASTYGAVVLKSDLVASPSTALSAYGLGDLSRWGTSGSERIYDGVTSFASARSSAATAFDHEFCEVGEAFDEILSSALDPRAGVAYATTISSTINWLRTPAFHAGVIGAGYVLQPTSGSVTVNGFTNINGVSFSPKTATADANLVSINGTFSSIKNCICFGFSNLYSTGIFIWTNAVYCRVENNISLNLLQGFVNYGAQDTTVTGNLATKCGYGFRSGLDGTSYRFGYWYNNISIGNTTNWGVKPTSLQDAANNYGLVTDGIWATGAGGVRTIATSDFAGYAGNDFRPAVVTSPQVDTAISVYNIALADIRDAVRPSYKNGEATAIDAGPFEFDHGYGPWPVSNTLTLTGLISGSDIVVLAAGTSTILTSVDSNSGGTYGYTYSALQNVDIGIIKPGYKVKYIRNYPLSASNVSIPVEQQIDPSYA